MSNLPTVWTNVMAGWFLAGGNWTVELLWMITGVSLLYVGGMTLNDAFDAEWDAEHAVDRPIPAGAISLRSVWVLGWGQMVAGILVVTIFTHALWYCVLALVFAIVIYDWTHKWWKGAVLAMGACRFLVYTVAASALIDGGGGIPADVWVFAGGLFFYVVGITIAARGESTGGTVGWWGKGLLLFPMVAGIIVITERHGFGWDLISGGILAIGVFVLWLAYSMRQLRSTRPDRIGKFVTALLAGIILIDLIALAQFGVIFWPICGGLLVLTLLAQRWIPAT